MRIGVVEWVCGGGLLEVSANALPQSLLREGWLMLSTLIRDLLDAGHQVQSTLDGRCVPLDQRLRIQQAECKLIEAPSDCQDASELWTQFFRDVDRLVVIAPESEGVLENMLQKFKDAGIACVNCSGEFLTNTCDKLRTSCKLSCAGLAHPATISASAATSQWLTENSVASGYWAVKPLDGAGCDGLQRLNTDQVNRFIAQTGSQSSSKMLIQPWLEGLPCSRSAIVDRAGTFHWLPLVTQHLSSGEQPKYLGGRVLASLATSNMNPNAGTGASTLENITTDQLCVLGTLLDQAMTALGSGGLGWIGVDLLFHNQQHDHPFTIIEVNPRMTTSSIGLSRSCGGRLANQLINAAVGVPVALPTIWNDVAFDCV